MLLRTYHHNSVSLTVARASALSQGLQNAGIRVSAADIRLAFRLSEAHAIVLLWQKQGIITRISLRFGLPEILFIWGEQESSTALIEDVLKRLARARDLTASDGMRGASQFVASASVGEVIRPAWVSQHFSITQDAAIEILLDACKKLTCRPVFRIKDEGGAPLSSRTWVTDISLLPSTYLDSDGNPVDSLRPENIEIAFERVAR